MKVAAYQSRIATPRNDALRLIREQVDQCESLGVEIMCCAEGVLGGLADYVEEPASIAIDVGSGQLDEVLAQIASETVTTILGFTEIARDGRLYNSAAIHHRGAVVGIYRKLHPAINRSVYQPGRETPVFTVGSLTIGILICRDSVFAEPARAMITQGATMLFVPTNNGMPPGKGGRELVTQARSRDIALAVEHRVAVVRADVAGQTARLTSYGSSGIIGRNGDVLEAAPELATALLVADMPPAPSSRSKR